MIVMVLAGVLIGQSYEHSSRQELESRANNALEQIGMRLDAVFEASKAVSYDGVVRNSYRLYQREGDKAVLYRTVTDYLNQNFTRDERVLSAFITFWEDIGVYPYAASRGDQGYSAQREYRDTIEPDLLERMGDIDTGIVLLEYGGELYVARNLLDSRFQPYATVTLLCDREVLFQSMEPVKSISKSCSLTLDDRLLLSSDGSLITTEQLPPPSTGSVFTYEVSGHTLCLTLLFLWRCWRFRCYSWWCCCFAALWQSPWMPSFRQAAICRRENGATASPRSLIAGSFRHSSATLTPCPQN